MRWNRISRLVALLGSVGVALTVMTCSDESTQPAVTSTVAAPPSLNLAGDESRRLRAAINFAGAQSVLALKHNQQQRDAAERVGAAFLSIAQHVKADDAAGADRALAAARAAVTRYRELTRGDDAAAADLAAMELTLEQATVLVREARQRTAPVPAAPR